MLELHEPDPRRVAVLQDFVVGVLRQPRRNGEDAQVVLSQVTVSSMDALMRGVEHVPTDLHLGMTS